MRKLRRLLRMSNPAVVESTSRLEKVIAWMAAKFDKSVDAFVTTFSKSMAVGAVGVAGIALSPVDEKVVRVFTAVLEWLDAVTLPF